ncbi:MAG: KdsC family phosphatase [Phycisphaeraceae bacterium]
MAISSLRLIVLDCDGVLTDGGLYVSEAGTETKRFHVRDGVAIKGAMLCGVQVAILSSRASRAVAQRAGELGITLLLQGAADKLRGLEQVAQWAGVELEEVAYMGDDLQDLPAMLACAYKLAPADAASEVRQAADHVTRHRGGHGAVREAIEHLLKMQGRWDEVLEQF